MAYPEDITKTDLENVRSLLSKIGSSESIQEVVNTSAFLTANDCLEYLKDVRRLVLEELKKLGEWRT